MPSGPSQARGGFSLWKQEDDFQLLQRAAGLGEDCWLKENEDLELDSARAQMKELARTRATLQNFGPCRSLFFVLGQVLSQGEDVPYAELLERLRPFHALVVMRPDGYLASALTGRPLQHMGRVELRQGRLMAGIFEVGAFYWDKGGVFYTADDSLNNPGILVGELGLEHDAFNAALDGAQDALGELALALGQLVTSPVRSVQGLGQLPSAVAALIASSPDYFARYSALPLQEQIREAARLSTHLLMLYGSAAGTVTRLGAAGAKLSVLTVTAQGALAIEQVTVPVGTMTAELGTGASAVYVLMGTGKKPGGSPNEQPANRGFKPFTEENFRENLARLTGELPEDAHAHHVFPQQFEPQFREAGINIHDPKYGTWWDRTSHLKNAVEYNRKWMRFLRGNPTFEQILQFGRELGGEYGFQVQF